MTDQQVIYSMVRVGKLYPPNHQVLRDISLGFFYGAKIGVLGLNGSGKTTLLRIMAGIDQDYRARSTFSKGYTVGLLEQEPQLDPGKTVRQVITEAVQPIVDLLARYDAGQREICRPRRRFRRPDRRAGPAAGAARQAGRLEPGQPPGAGDGRPALPPGETPVKVLSGGERRRVALAACCSPSRTSCCWTSRPTTWTPSRWPGWSTTCSSTRARSSPSPTTAISWITSPAGSWSWTAATASPGRAIIPPGWSRSRTAWLRRRSRESKRQKTLERELEWIRMSPKARQAKGKARVTAYEQLLSQETEKAPRGPGDLHPAGPRLGDIVIELNKVCQSLRRPAPVRRPDAEHPAREHRRRDRSQRRRQDHPAQADHRAGRCRMRGEIVIGETVKLAYVDQSRETLDRREDRLGGDFGRAGHDPARRAARATPAPTSPASISRHRPAEEGEGPLRRRAQPRPPGQDPDPERQRAAAGRADQRPGRQHPARAGRGAGRCSPAAPSWSRHDRWFLDRVATHILAFEGDSQVRWFDGNYSDYADDRRKRGLGEEIPQRIRYRNLTR